MLAGDTGTAVLVSCVFQLLLVGAGIIGLWLLAKFLGFGSAQHADTAMRDSDGNEPIATLRWHE